MGNGRERYKEVLQKAVPAPLKPPTSLLAAFFAMSCQGSLTLKIVNLLEGDRVAGGYVQLFRIPLCTHGEIFADGGFAILKFEMTSLPAKALKRRDVGRSVRGDEQ